LLVDILQIHGDITDTFAVAPFALGALAREPIHLPEHILGTLFALEWTLLNFP
jgi:hypothetical protein